MTAADPDPDTVEAVAREIWDEKERLTLPPPLSWEKATEYDRDFIRQIARAAIAAYRKAQGGKTDGR